MFVYAKDSVLLKIIPAGKLNITTLPVLADVRNLL